MAAEMKLSEFVNKTIDELDGILYDGIVAFDVPIKRGYDGDVIVDNDSISEKARVKFEVRMKNTDNG